MPACGGGAASAFGSRLAISCGIWRAIGDQERCRVQVWKSLDRKESGALTWNRSFTLAAVLAEVSMKYSPFSAAYDCASSVLTALWASRSALLPVGGHSRQVNASGCGACRQNWSHLGVQNESTIVTY